MFENWFPQDMTTLRKLLWFRTAWEKSGKPPVPTDPLSTFVGSIVRFFSHRALPVVKLEANFTPIQSGSGDPSPTNIRPLSGHTGCEVVRTGVNVWDEQWEVGVIATNGNLLDQTDSIRSANYIPVKPSTTYYFYIGKSTYRARVVYFNSGKTAVGSKTVAPPFDFTTPSDCVYIKICTLQDNEPHYGDTYLNDISINYPSTDHDYHAYSGTTVSISFGQTVYGGKLTVFEDGSGQVVVEKAIVHAKDLTWSLGGNTSQNGTYYLASASAPFKGWGNGGYDSAISNALVKAGSSASYSNAPANSFWWNNASTGYRCIWGEPNNGSTKEEFEAFLTDNDVVFCGELAEPVTIPLTASQINTLVGENVVWVNDSDYIQVTAYGTEIV